MKKETATLANRRLSEARTKERAERGPFFGQIPQDLIRDPDIPIPARLLYGVYHTYAKKKDLKKEDVWTYVSQKELAKVLGCCIQSVSDWTGILKETGWISVTRRMNKSNLVYLHGKPERRANGA